MESFLSRVERKKAHFAEPEIYIEEVTQGDFYDDDLVDCKDLDPEIEPKVTIFIQRQQKKSAS